MRNRQSVLVVGAGAIGTAMAAVFSASGFPTTVLDPDAAARAGASNAVARHLRAMARAGFPADAACGCEIVARFEDAEPATLVIEAGPERVEAKRAIFQAARDWAGPDAVIATTSSAIPVSAILPDAGDQAMALVAHPANPPSLLRILELVPAPATRPEAVEIAREIFSRAGFDPVALGLEIPAFVFNRLQSALLREAYRLVGEGVIAPGDLDRLVRDGLGPRWALSGPFETADLNTAGGIRGHAARMGPAYAAIGRARGETDCDWPDALVERVETDLRARTLEADLPKRRAWRERALADLLAARRELMSDASDD